MHLPTLLAQIGLILMVARLVGWLFGKIHQPQVIGEMLAGILLGPSLLGWLLPEVSVALFAPEHLSGLNALSQIGLLLFMFLIGLEFDPQIIRGRGQLVAVAGLSGIITPFVLGAVLAVYLYSAHAPAGVAFLPFALFLGTAMSITAFPVLARILTERNLLHTPLGSAAIACAALNDVVAWCILAGVVLLVRSTAESASLGITLIGTLVFIALMLSGIRRILRLLEALYLKQPIITHHMLAFILLFVIVCASITEWLGIHALFGAFLAGVVMPRHAEFRHALTVKLADLTIVLLLPLFFAFTGLRTSIGLLNGMDLWATCLLIIGVAIIGKFGGAMLPARYLGMTWREASALGILMNTRGLIELVILNVGLEIGVISPTLFTMMVLMALATTFMTTPLLRWVFVVRK